MHFYHSKRSEMMSGDFIPKLHQVIVSVCELRPQVHLTPWFPHENMQLYIQVVQFLLHVCSRNFVELYHNRLTGKQFKLYCKINLFWGHKLWCFIIFLFKPNMPPSATLVSERLEPLTSFVRKVQPWLLQPSCFTLNVIVFSCHWSSIPARRLTSLFRQTLLSADSPCLILLKGTKSLTVEAADKNILSFK